MVTKNWTAAAGGQWADAADWSPVGQPGAGDAATITGPEDTAADQVINGPGTAATLLLLGNTDLRGAVAIGTMTVGGTATAARLDLDSASMLAAATVALVDGTISVSGAGTALVATGALAIGGLRTSYLYQPNTISMTSGATVQVSSVIMAPPTYTTNGTTYSAGFDEIDVDSTSSLEVGAAGGATLGALTVDAGHALVGAGAITPLRVVNQGTITAQAGSLVLSGTITGTGTLSIAAGASLAIHTSTNAVQFAGPGGTLSVDQVSTSWQSGGVLSFTYGLGETGVISGFASGDLIAYVGGPVPTAVTYRSDGLGLGTLTLLSGSTSLGTLTLAGDYAAAAFQVTQGSSVYDIGFAAPGTPSTTPSPGTSTIDAYVWTASNGGLWGSSANWRDATTNMSPAAIAPGILDTVSINTTGPISGSGNSASLTLTDAPVLDGTFSTGALVAGDRAAATIATGGSVMAATAMLNAATLTVMDDGSSLIVGGAITIGGATTILEVPFSSLSAEYGGSVTAQSIVLAPSYENGLSGGLSPAGSESLLVDQDSTIEVGTGGHVPAGTLAIDAGHSITGLGTITAPFIANQGTIAAEGGTLLLAGTVSGTGALQIGAGATLVVQNSAAPVAFTGAGGILQIGSTTAPAIGVGVLTAVTTLGEQGVISGFSQGDTIDVTEPAGSTIPTWLIYKAASSDSGTLMLMHDTTSLGALALQGQFAGDSFQLTTAANGSVAITVAPAFTSPDPLFDVNYYLTNNPDVAAAGVDPYQHYMTTGWKEGRNPSALFNTNFYLNQNPDVKAAGVNPLTHFETNGWLERRDPSMAFSDSQYLAHNPDVAAAHIDPLLHYEQNGQYEGRAIYAVTPHATGPQDPLVDAAYVYAHNPQVAAQGLDASAWYNSVGWQQGANPDAFFDTKFYLTQNPDVAAAGIDPLTHFETNGYLEGRQPSLLFDDAKYLAANPDVAAAGIDPLVHYEQHGQFEGRMTFLTGGSATPDPLIDAAYYDAQLGATLIPGGAAGQAQAAASYDASGWQKGLNPDAFFDTSYYLQQNPDVAAAHIGPLLHYETNGWHEGRNPSAGFDTNKYLAAYPDVAAAGIDPLLHYVQNGMMEGRMTFAV